MLDATSRPRKTSSSAGGGSNSAEPVRGARAGQQFPAWPFSSRQLLQGATSTRRSAQQKPKASVRSAPGLRRGLARSSADQITQAGGGAPCRRRRDGRGSAANSSGASAREWHSGNCTAFTASAWSENHKNMTSAGTAAFSFDQSPLSSSSRRRKDNR